MLLPAATDVGKAEFVVTKSAWVPVATTSAAVAALFVVLGSLTDELTLTVSLIAVPAVAVALTFTTYVIVAGVPGASEGFVQVSVASVQSQPAGPARETEVVLAGNDSLTVVPVAALGPALVTTCV